MLTKIADTIKKNNMIEKGDNIICALSGGADSMALLCALSDMRERLGIKLYAAHLNHCIRGKEADGDMLFVKRFCEDAGIELFIKKADIPKIAKQNHMSEEECGREERYKFFDDILKGLGKGKIATAHHRGDNAETILFNLFRGSSARGLRGIPYKRGNIIRPMLDVTRSEIVEFLEKRGITWREDSTNKETRYARNRIRLVILKDIEKIFPDAVNKITSAAESIRRDDEYLTYLAREAKAFENGAIIKERFLPLDESLRMRVILFAFEEWGVLPEREKMRAVYETVLGDTGKKRDLGNNICIVNSYGKIFKRAENTFERSDEKYGVKAGESIEIVLPDGVWEIKTVDKREDLRDNKTIILLDADKIKGELFVRYRKDGDYILPKGMNGKKKLKKVFIDLKIDAEKRDMISMLTIGDEVLFIPGIRKTRNYMPDEKTKRILTASYKRCERCERDG